MKYYLSSYNIGGRPEKLQELARGNRIGVIPNAIDFLSRAEWSKSTSQKTADLSDLGIEAVLLDLKEYFGRKEELQKVLDTLGGVWVRGGNTFVLRQAMKLSGFDDLITSMERKDFLYAGYSAGICVLAPSLRALQQVDDPNQKPYGEHEVIWEGLGLLDYIILPHYKSDHPESADIDKEVAFCEQNNIPYKTLRDGEVLIIDN